MAIAKKRLGKSWRLKPNRYFSKEIKIMLKSILKKLLMKLIAKKFGFYPTQKYYKPTRKKGLAYKLKKFFD